MAKLTSDQVAEIRRRYRRNGNRSNAPALAEEYGVCTAHIRRIVRGVLWRETRGSQPKP